MLTYLLLSLLVITTVAYFAGLSRSYAVSGGQISALHSRPGYYGGFVAAYAFLPALLLTLLWLLFQGTVIDSLVLSSFPEDRVSQLSDGQLDLLLAEVRQVARGNIFGQPDDTILAAAHYYNAWREFSAIALFVSAIAVAIGAAFFAWTRISKNFWARQAVERIIAGFMITCALIAILTTAGIVLSLLFESIRFFEIVPVQDFLFGWNWEPQIALRADQIGISGAGAFGAIPVIIGSVQIAFLAMAVATPLGLFTAIYMTEYANPRFRAVIKPVIEILAGIPTVVYGFFAILVVAPALRDFGTAIGLSVTPNSALAAGLVMGIMIIPFISSLSDDAISAVPRAMRDGSYAMGATRGETITRVVLPAALPGIMGGVLLGTSKAIGETMIVVMAAGIIANLTLNPLEPVTTITVQIITLLIGDHEFDNPKTLAAFALGLLLFISTLVLNIIALRIVQKYRERYE